MLAKPETCPCSPPREERRWVAEGAPSLINNYSAGRVETITGAGYHEFRQYYKPESITNSRTYYCIYCLKELTVTD